MSLTIEQIIAAHEEKVAEVRVPEWGGSVFVRRLSGLDAIELSGNLRSIEGDEAHTAKERLVMALAAYLCDADGNTIATVENARAVAAKNSAVLDRIVGAGHKLNSVDDASIEALTKN